MRDQLSFVESNGQQVEPPPARAASSLFTASDDDGAGSDADP